MVRFNVKLIQGLSFPEFNYVMNFYFGFMSNPPLLCNETSFFVNGVMMWR